MPTKENSSLPLLISPRLEGENNREYERGGTERKAGNEPYPGA